MNRLTCSTALTAALLATGCGGGGDSSPSGTLRLSLTDAPACGYDSVFVTVEKVRIHRSSTAAESDAGWSEVVLATPQRVDLLTLTNGTLLPLGQTLLPAGTYTQMRLVLAPNTPANPKANAITPTGGSEVALTTPSGAQSGLKMNVDIEIAPGTVADFAIDFDACKSFVRAGNSGQILLKPVLSVMPVVSNISIVGYLDPSLVAAGTSVSAQVGGVLVRATPPDSSGRFTLFPVPTGNYDLVITAAGRVNAVMTGVPVTATGTTTIGSTTARINTPTSAASYAASGTVIVNGIAANTNGVVRALQILSGGPTIEVGSANATSDAGAYSLLLPAGAPVKTAYVAGATSFSFAGNAADAGKYRLEASAPTFTAKTADITLAAPVVTPFAFPAP